MIKNREAAHRANACEQSLHVGRERATKTGVSNQEENVLKQDRSSSDLPQACSIASGTKVICKGATMATVMPPHCSPARIDCHTSISGRERLRSRALVLGSPVRVLSARVHGRASQSAYYERSRRHSGASSGRPAAHACALRAAGTECTRICRTNLFWYLSTVPAVDHFLIFTTSPTPLLTLLTQAFANCTPFRLHSTYTRPPYPGPHLPYHSTICAHSRCLCLFANPCAHSRCLYDDVT